MQFQRLRVWQWCLIGAFIGAIGGFAWTQYDAEDSTIPTRDLRSLTSGLARKTDDGKPVYTNIRIDPVQLDASGKPVQQVTYTELMRHKDTKQWEPVRQWRSVAPIPVFPKSPNKDNRIADLLADEQKRTPELTYGYNWWKLSNVPADFPDRELKFWQRPNNAMIFAVVVGMVLVGGVWPLVIRALVAAGLGYPEEPKSKDDLAGVRVRTAEAAAPMTIDASEAQKLADLNAQLEENVAGMLISQDEEDEAEEIRKEEAVIKKLEGQRLEAQEAARVEQEAKDFAGQYYPVARPVAKKD